MHRRKITLAVVLLLMALISASAAPRGPVIGVITQPASDAGSIGGNHTQYLNSGYVKWLESGGARVIPIPYKATNDQLEEYFKRINGVLFPGGDTSFTNKEFANTLTFFFKKSTEMTDADPRQGFPIWGTCLGFQMLHILANNGRPDTIVPAESYNQSLSLQWTYDINDDSKTAKLFSLLPRDERLRVQEYFQNVNSTDNWHHFGVYPEEYEQYPSLKSFFRILATSTNYNDRKNKPFVALVEAHKYPIYGAQFHPERLPYEWYESSDLPKTFENIRAQQYFVSFFVDQARRLNSHAFQSDAELNMFNIHNYPVTFAARYVPEEDQGYYFFYDHDFPPFTSGKEAHKPKVGHRLMAISQAIAKLNVTAEILQMQ